MIPYGKQQITEEDIKAVTDVLQSPYLTQGPVVPIFEEKVSSYVGSKYGIAVGSGTDALAISLLALNLKKGDEVITAANTAIPTISAIILAGAKPKLVDVGEDYLIDHKKIVNSINKNTKAIIVVHLHGAPVNMTKVMSIAKKYKI